MQATDSATQSQATKFFSKIANMHTAKSRPPPPQHEFKRNDDV